MVQKKKSKITRVSKTAPKGGPSAKKNTDHRKKSAAPKRSKKKASPSSVKRKVAPGTSVRKDVSGESSGRMKRAGQQGQTRTPVRNVGAVTQERKAPSVAKQKKRTAGLPIVGIGASAGGLEALTDFFNHMPSDCGMGFVVVTHQHPGHVSLLPDLLSRTTKMPVVEAKDGLKVEANHVYVGIAGAPLSISQGVLRHLDLDMSHLPNMPIDHFFRSLASDQREHAICIVLSGTGTDGTLGVRAVKAEAGMAMVQKPPSAKYAGMPSSASATGLADYILPVASMPDQLIAYVRGPYLRVRIPTVHEAPLLKPAVLQQLLWQLKQRCGHDFSSYKPTTIQRRIERRMNVHQIAQHEDYIRYVKDNPHELDMLFTELLISVTSFFRDREAFKILGEKAIPELFRRRDGDRPLRVWVPGCATGEEAYSLAVLLNECMEKSPGRLDVQIFATDLDAHAIEVARAGVYAGSVTGDISKKRLSRYFVREDNVYRIRREIREMLVFAVQNVIKDPPFTKLDMIMCRNLLIYLDAKEQQRLLNVFHYALMSDGLLFLGPSETIAGLGDLFDKVDGKWKIFRRKQSAHGARQIMGAPMGLSEQRANETHNAAADRPVKQVHTDFLIERMLLNRFAPLSLVVDAKGDIAYIQGRAGEYLEPTQGQPRNNVLEMARPGLGRALGGLMRKAASEKQEVEQRNVRVKTNSKYTRVHLCVAPIQEPQGICGLLLVSIQPDSGTKRHREPEPSKQQKTRGGRAEELERELQYTKESLQTTIEELETSNEELKSTNEELQSTNEELQSTNEEMETSKEELQSLNEELSTVNAELMAKVDELTSVKNDMQNLLNSTEVATIFLDEELCVKRYTDRAKKLVRLINTDLGRPLSDLAVNLEYQSLEEDCREVLRSLVSREAHVRSMSGAWHLMRIMPYRTVDNVIEGVVITFIEIDRLKREPE